MNSRQARARALHASCLQVEALLEAEYLFGFPEVDRPKIQRELEHIANRLMERAMQLDPSVTDHTVYVP